MPTEETPSLPSYPDVVHLPDQLGLHPLLLEAFITADATNTDCSQHPHVDAEQHKTARFASLRLVQKMVVAPVVQGHRHLIVEAGPSAGKTSIVIAATIQRLIDILHAGGEAVMVSNHSNHPTAPPLIVVTTDSISANKVQALMEHFTSQLGGSGLLPSTVCGEPAVVAVGGTIAEYNRDVRSLEQRRGSNSSPLAIIGTAGSILQLLVEGFVTLDALQILLFHHGRETLLDTFPHPQTATHIASIDGEEELNSHSLSLSCGSASERLVRFLHHHADAPKTLPFQVICTSRVSEGAEDEHGMCENPTAEQLEADLGYRAMLDTHLFAPLAALQGHRNTVDGVAQVCITTFQEVHSKGVYHFCVEVGPEWKMDTVLDLEESISVVNSAIFCSHGYTASWVAGKITACHVFECPDSYNGAGGHANLLCMADDGSKPFPRQLPSASIIINYDVPSSADSYKRTYQGIKRHSCKNTVVINFVSQFEVKALRKIEQTLSLTIEELPLDFCEYLNTS